MIVSCEHVVQCHGEVCRLQMESRLLISRPEDQAVIQDSPDGLGMITKVLQYGRGREKDQGESYVP